MQVLLGCPDQKNRKMAITCEVLVRFFSFFDMLCIFDMICYKWALPPSGLERPFGPICSLAPDGSAHLFFVSFERVDDFT